MPVWSFEELRIPHNFVDCVVYLYKDVPSAESGDNMRAATGFWASAKTTSGVVTLLVTNRHVIEEGTTVVRYAASDGAARVFETDDRQWHHHPDPNVDVSVLLMPITDASDAHAFLIDVSTFITPSDLTNFDVRLGDDLCMVGRHINYDGKTTNNPTARFGYLCQFPLEKIKDDKGREFEAYLAQIPSLPGFSGSPVFLCQDESEKGMETNMLTLGNGSRRMLLLGVNSGHIPAYGATFLTQSGIRNEGIDAEINSGIITVVPAYKIYDAIVSLLT